MTKIERMIEAATKGEWRLAKDSMGCLSIFVEVKGKTRFVADVRGRYAEYSNGKFSQTDLTTESEVNAEVISLLKNSDKALAALVKAVRERMNYCCEGKDENCNCELGKAYAALPAEWREDEK